MLTDELHTSLFDGQPHLLAEPVGMWLASSRRFTAFANAYHTKIRKKLRATREPESLLDLRLELETAYLLLQERLLSVEYEPAHCGQERCPDFAVSYTTSLTFTVEVTRLRAVQKATSSPEVNSGTPVAGERLADTICSKLGQLLPRQSNVLIIGVEALSLSQTDLHAAMRRVQQRAERNDPVFWQRYPFRDRAEFFQQYQRLGEVLLRPTQLQPGQPPVVWVNPQARHPLPGRVQSALYRSHTLQP
jgi:hypothetical protein